MKELEMKRVSAIILGLLLVAAAAVADVSSQDQPFPGILINARYVYVTSYDGDQFSQYLLPEDRQAIATVQDALQKWGRYIVVYRPQDADMIIAVQSRGSEDVLAVYDAHSMSPTYLWRAMGRGGLDKGEVPLVAKLQAAVEKASRRQGS
jgi:hypothetical protein